MATVKQVRVAALLMCVLYPALGFGQITTVTARAFGAAADPKPTAPLILRLRDIAGFSGGQDLALDGNGNLFVRIARLDPYHAPARPYQPPSRFWGKRFHIKLAPAALSELLTFVRASGVTHYQERTRNGVSDEPRPVIRVALPGQRPFEVAKWADDKDVNFDALYNRLLELTKRAAQTPPYREQPYASARGGAFP
jgi:hypothetical protein